MEPSDDCSDSRSAGRSNSATVVLDALSLLVATVTLIIALTQLLLKLHDRHSATLNGPPDSATQRT
jgi:hypothetical protein